MDGRTSSSPSSKNDNQQRVLTLKDLDIPELANETRLFALYGRIPSSDVDVNKRNDMLKFWETAIARYCDAKGTSVFTVSELKRAFKTKEGITPMALRSVVRVLTNKSANASACLRTEEEFLEVLQRKDVEGASSSTLISALRGLTSWLTTTVKTTLLQQPAREGDEEGEDDDASKRHQDEEENVRLVWLPLVKSNAEIALKALRDSERRAGASSIANLCTFDEFQNIASEALAESERELEDVVKEVQLVLAQFAQSKEVALCWHSTATSDRIIGLKLLSQPATSSSNKQATKSLVASPSESDRSVLLMKHTIRSLERQIEQLENNCEKCRDTAKQLLAKKRKNEAILQLARQRQLKSLLEKRSSALHNLQTVLETIEQTQTDQQVYEAIVEGTKTLKSMQKEVSADKIEDAMFELEEALTDQKEIDEVLTKGLASSASIEDESELESELDSLVHPQGKDKEEEEEKQKQKLLQKEEDGQDVHQEIDEPIAWPVIPEEKIANEADSEEKSEEGEGEECKQEMNLVAAQ